MCPYEIFLDATRKVGYGVTANIAASHDRVTGRGSSGFDSPYPSLLFESLFLLLKRFGQDSSATVFPRNEGHHMEAWRARWRRSGKDHS